MSFSCTAQAFGGLACAAQELESIFPEAEILAVPLDMDLQLGGVGSCAV